MTQSAEPLVIFTPSGRRGRFPEGTSVLDAARALGVDIDSVCGGRGLCGRCQVEQGVGSFAKHGIVSLAEHLTPPGALEAGYRGLRALPPHRRLSCLAALRGDAVIDVPWTRQMFADRPDAFFVQPAGIADAVHHLVHQERSAWTFALDLRPFGENW